jgi:hypothetical protein
MGKNAKKKPLYDDNDRDGGFLVISNPWGMDVAGRRTQAHVDAVGSWLHQMCNKATAEVVYMQDTVSFYFMSLLFFIEISLMY